MEEVYKLGSNPDWSGTRVELFSMVLDQHGLTLTASNADTEIVINFKSMAFRQMDEGDALTIPWDQVEGGKQFFIGTVQESAYVDWFIRQSYGIHIKEELTHYVLAFNNDIVDVIAYKPPTVSRTPATS